MTRCPEFYDKYEKDGNFCGLSPSAITQIKAYNEMRETIGKHIPDRAFIVENFPEYAARAIANCAKDNETKTKALNYVVSCLKRGEKVTHNDLEKTIKGWLKPGSCAVEKHPDNAGHVSKKFTYVNSPTEQKPDPAPALETSAQDPHALSAQMAGTVPPEPVKPYILPCKGGDGCSRGKFRPRVSKDAIKGDLCDAIGVEISQLPGNMCPYDAKLERQKPVMQAAPVDTGFETGNGKKDFVTPKAPEAAARPPTNEKDLCEAFLRVVLDNGPEADFVRRLADTEFNGDVAQAEREIHIRVSAGGA